MYFILDHNLQEGT